MSELATIAPPLQVTDVSRFKRGGFGLVDGMMADEYRTDEGLSQSELNVFNDSPRDFRAGVMRTATPSMRNGSLLHGAILEGSLDAHIRPDVYGAEGKAWNANANECKLWLAKHSDKPAISLERSKEILSIVNYVHQHPHAGQLLCGGFAELSCFAKCPHTGRRIRGRLDYVKFEPDWVTIVDLKTTRDGDTREFSKTILYQRYHVQAAFYRRILQALGARFVRYYLIPLEEGESPRVNVRELNPRAIDKGEEVMNENLEKLAECERTNNWPEWGDSLDTGSIPYIDLPDFCYNDDISPSTT